MRILQVTLCLLSSMLFTACLDADAPDDLAPVDETVAALIGDPTPVKLCGDLHETFEEPQSCTYQGQLGIKTCTQSCTIHRTPVFHVPPQGITCAIVSSDCSGWSCGPCVVVGPEGPLGPL